MKTPDTYRVIQFAGASDVFWVSKLIFTPNSPEGIWANAGLDGHFQSESEAREWVRNIGGVVENEKGDER